VVTSATVLEVATKLPQHSGGDEPSGYPAAIAAGLFLAAAAALSFASSGIAGAAARFVDTALYQQRVLERASSGTRVAVPNVGWSVGGFLLELGVVASAIALALALPAFRRVMRRPKIDVGTIVRRVHDGGVADSATWLTVGTAVMMVALLR
jgi:hypothetical protein